MDIQTLDCAARLSAIDLVVLIDGYSRKGKNRLFRRFTMDDIREIPNVGYRGYWFEANDGKAWCCRVNGRLKTWKRDPDRFEQGFKYGLYETARWNTQEMLNRLLVPIGGE